MSTNFAWPQQGQMNPPQSQAPTPWGGATGQPGFGASHTPAQPQLIAGDGAPISFAPATFTEGGMIDNVWVRFSNGRATTYDYKGKSSAGPAPAVIYDLQIVDANTHQPIQGAAPQEKVWTVGKLEDFQPRANGLQFWSPSGKKGFNKASNWAVFIKAAVAAGIPENVFASGQVDALNGLVAFVEQVKNNDRAGMRTNTTANAGGNEDRGTLVVTQIPGGARVNTATAAGAPQPMGQPIAHAPAPMMQAPMAQPMQMPQAPIAQPMAQPMQFQQPAPMAQAPQPMAQPQAPGVDRVAAQRLLAEVLSTNPTSKQAFNVALFSRALTDEPLRNLVASPQFQAEMLGSPLNLA